MPNRARRGGIALLAALTLSTVAACSSAPKPAALEQADTPTDAATGAAAASAAPAASAAASASPLTVTRADGSKVTTITRADGTKVTVVTTKDGKTTTTTSKPSTTSNVAPTWRSGGGAPAPA